MRSILHPFPLFLLSIILIYTIICQTSCAGPPEPETRYIDSKKDINAVPPEN